MIARLQALWLAGMAAAAVSVGPHGYARHLRAVQRHLLAVDRRHPPIYYFFCSVYYAPRQSDPLGPLEIVRPASCDIAVRWLVPVIVGRGG